MLCQTMRIIFLIFVFLLSGCASQRTLVMDGKNEFICESEDKKTIFKSVTKVNCDTSQCLIEIDDDPNPNSFEFPPKGICNTYSLYNGCDMHFTNYSGVNTWKIVFDQKKLKYKLYFLPIQEFKENPEDYTYTLLEEGNCKFN